VNYSSIHEGYFLSRSRINSLDNEHAAKISARIHKINNQYNPGSADDTNKQA